MNYEKGKCQECKGIYFIVNKTKKLCQQCNYKRLHGGKTEYQIESEKQSKKPIKQNIKPKNKTIKPTGELEMFKEIWDEREHICTHCKKPLLQFNVCLFAHIKPKSTHLEFRLVKTNVKIKCFECHFSETNNSKEIYEKRKDLYLKPEYENDNQ